MATFALISVFILFNTNEVVLFANIGKTFLAKGAERSNNAF